MNLLLTNLVSFLIQAVQPLWNRPWFLGLMVALVLLFGALVEFIIWLIKRRRKATEEDKEEKDDLEIPDVFEE
jgi:membrane protein DedA with SNARE-associated domain